VHEERDETDCEFGQRNSSVSGMSGKRGGVDVRLSLKRGLRDFKQRAESGKNIKKLREEDTRYNNMSRKKRSEGSRSRTWPKLKHRPVSVVIFYTTETEGRES